jgi:hypothetical protein
MSVLVSDSNFQQKLEANQLPLQLTFLFLQIINVLRLLELG